MFEHWENAEHDVVVDGQTMSLVSRLLGSHPSQTKAFILCNKSIHPL